MRVFSQVNTSAYGGWRNMLIYPFCEFGEKLREKVVQTSEMVNSSKKYKKPV